MKTFVRNPSNTEVLILFSNINTLLHSSKLKGLHQTVFGNSEYLLQPPDSNLWLNNKNKKWKNRKKKKNEQIYFVCYELLYLIKKMANYQVSLLFLFSPFFNSFPIYMNLNCFSESSSLLELLKFNLKWENWINLKKIWFGIFFLGLNQNLTVFFFLKF